MIEYKLPAGLEITHFKDGGHWFTYQGHYLKSVGKILNTVFPMPEINPYYLTRGIMIHNATVMIDAGNLDWRALDPRLTPYCKAYQSFLEMSHPIVEASELIVVASDCTHGGRLDRVFRLPGRERLIVADIKVGSGKEERYWLQIAAYALLLAGEHVADVDLEILNLQKNGQPRLTVAPDPGSKVAEWRGILSNYLTGGNA